MTKPEGERSSIEKHGGARWNGDAAEPGCVWPLCAEAYENAPYLRNPHLLRPLLRRSKQWIATTEIHNVDSPGIKYETETEESL